MPSENFFSWEAGRPELRGIRHLSRALAPWSNSGIPASSGPKIYRYRPLIARTGFSARKPAGLAEPPKRSIKFGRPNNSPRSPPSPARVGFEPSAPRTQPRSLVVALTINYTRHWESQSPAQTARSGSELSLAWSQETPQTPD
ncbi:MAG: hypothetical protein LBR11_06615 [Deltaproteobacteria bacterium]|nr:hypothetical protein [Deltaproteobacteria bacterium]